MGSTPTDTPTEDRWKTMHNGDFNAARKRLHLAQLNFDRIERQWLTNASINGYLREEWSLTEHSE